MHASFLFRFRPVHETHGNTTAKESFPTGIVDGAIGGRVDIEGESSGVGNWTADCEGLGVGKSCDAGFSSGTGRCGGYVAVLLGRGKEKSGKLGFEEEKGEADRLCGSAVKVSPSSARGGHKFFRSLLTCEPPEPPSWHIVAFERT